MVSLYDEIGQSYATTRAADVRIVERLVALLDLLPGAVVCDVGAGSGNYANALAARGYQILAVEPSVAMRSQARPHPLVTWAAGVAEDLPLDDGAAAGLVSTLASHHFTDLERAFREIARVCPSGPVVLFTLDPRRRPLTWIETYFPQIREIDMASFQAAEAVLELGSAALGRDGAIEPFDLPPDLADNFLFAPWNRPEVMLDATFRANTSGFARSDPSNVARGLERLERDLRTGSWDTRYGNLRTASAYDAGFCFVHF
jgi:SAM-dependent methyltransferase